MDSNRKKAAEGVPLAMIIKREIKESPAVVMISQPRSVYAEKFRRLKTTLVHKFKDEARVIVVTSGVPGEGKSTVCLNLALAFAAEGGERTLLIDGDMRRPAIGSMLNPPPQIGLSELLMGSADLVHAVLHLSNSALHVLPGGTPSNDPLELVTSRQAKDLFVALKERYDRIIIDSPPLIPFADADALGAYSDGVVVVARAGTTPKSVFVQEISAITSTKILGIVLNGVSDNPADGKVHHDRYYHAYYDQRRD